jgi:pseudaminic acid cytidylyltransferase
MANNPERRLKLLEKCVHPGRSQDLEEAHRDAGQFYWGRAAGFRERLSLYAGNAVPVILPRYRVQDIDTVEDWRQAELMYGALTAAAGSGKS